MPHLEADGAQYYTPAILCWVLNNYQSRQEWLIDATFYHLGTVSQDVKTHKEKQFSLFTKEQNEACIAFLEYFVENDPLGKYVDTPHIKKALERRWKNSCF